ncbi:MAG TPA: hypothetical protein VLI69_09150 [Gammaproteobacteria bacterium]|nr:hypothetical protein [Gammaproteobacteria bacterium]
MLRQQLSSKATILLNNALAINSEMLRFDPDGDDARKTVIKKLVCEYEENKDSASLEACMKTFSEVILVNKARELTLKEKLLEYRTLALKTIPEQKHQRSAEEQTKIYEEFKAAFNTTLQTLPQLAHRNESLGSSELAWFIKRLQNQPEITQLKKQAYEFNERMNILDPDGDESRQEEISTLFDNKYDIDMDQVRAFVKTIFPLQLKEMSKCKAIEIAEKHINILSALQPQEIQTIYLFRELKKLNSITLMPLEQAVKELPFYICKLTKKINNAKKLANRKTLPSIREENGEMLSCLLLSPPKQIIQELSTLPDVRIKVPSSMNGV